ncbi:GNAT family N-acetyltransferase [Clostridium sp. Sa3CUN1]|uniref:GNAT family N-acetyltransferase n=1 Tax=Clostridium gallinarum TaxID=2762246 RepID=A0ABR8Q5J5_9CLOT|nr:GNAT family protein [Clostridium gallinarum]MBD7915645.1 GNAT family N-acetyltransferase [Clostridium gallinarum]
MYFGKKVVLREFREEDIKIATSFINDYDIATMLTKQAIIPISKEAEEQSIRNRSKLNDNRIDFAIESIEEEKYIGNCSIVNIDYKNSNCVIGIKIGSKDDWGKGYGTDAINVLLKFIFFELNINKVKLTVYEYNERAINTYIKSGFNVEGRLIKEIYRNGKYYDEILLAIFKENFKQ